MREAQNADFRYLRIPVDANGGIEDYMRLHAVLFDPASIRLVAQRLSAKALEGEADATLRQRFEQSVEKLLKAFAKGGYSEIAGVIDASVPEVEREKAAQTYIRIVGNAAFEGLVLSRERAGLPTPKPDEATLSFLHESLNSMSDLFFYGTPFYLQLTSFEHRQASGFQLTRSPGKNVVYGGSVLLVLGIFAMIYLHERRIWLLVKPAAGQVLFAMSANRKNRDLDLVFARHQGQLQSLLQG